MRDARALLANVLVVAACALIYELLAATVASFVLGDTVAQFSIVIGAYLSAMGLGSFISRWFSRRLLRSFLVVELALSLVGGLSVPVLLVVFTRGGPFRALLYADVVVIGVLVGLELPLLMRMLKDDMTLKDVVARAFAFDYVGSLAASLLFPLVLVPLLGLVRTSIACGLVNCAIAVASTFVLRRRIDGTVTALRVGAAVVASVLLLALARADAITAYATE